jgi:hypothetical protein
VQRRWGCCSSHRGQSSSRFLEKPTLECVVQLSLPHVDNHRIAVHHDAAGEFALHGVVTSQVRIGLGAAQVVDGDNLGLVGRRDSYSARNVLRPMRPYPLMATLTAINALLTSILRRASRSDLPLAVAVKRALSRRLSQHQRQSAGIKPTLISRHQQIVKCCVRHLTRVSWVVRIGRPGLASPGWRLPLREYQRKGPTELAHRAHI